MEILKKGVFQKCHWGPRGGARRCVHVTFSPSRARRVTRRPNRPSGFPGGAFKGVLCVKYTMQATGIAIFLGCTKTSKRLKAPPVGLLMVPGGSKRAP